MKKYRIRPYSYYGDLKWRLERRLFFFIWNCEWSYDCKEKAEDAAQKLKAAETFYV